MKTVIKQNVIATLLLLLVMVGSRNAQAVVAPPVSDIESGKQLSSKSDISEEIKRHDARLQKIVVEMTVEQKRHEEKLENIKKELQQLGLNSRDQSNASQEKLWMPAKVAVFLDQDSK